MRLPRRLSATGLATATTATTTATATATTTPTATPPATATTTTTRFYYHHDFRGASLRQVSRSFFKMVAPWAAMSQDNYPSTSEDIVFLNTPGFVTAIWGLISPLIGEQTQSKIRFASAGASAVGESQPPSTPGAR